MLLADLYAEFTKEKQYLLNVTPKTLDWYQHSFISFNKFHNGKTLTDLSKASLTQTVLGMRDSGLSAVSVNVYMRAINSFLSWLHDNEYTKEHLRVKPLKTEKKVIQTFSDTHIKALVSWKPKDFYEHRLFALVALLLDCGIRIEEALTLERSRVDLDNNLLTVKGKGSKQRILPISYDLRKILFLWLKRHEYPLLFPTRDGARLSVRNIRRDFQALCKELHITGVRCSFHTLRHSFAYNYVKNGGNVFALQKMLGHESLQMSRRYCELQTEDLQVIQLKTSLLSKHR